MTTRRSLAITRTSISTTELRDEPLGALAPGHVRLRVDELAFTANTVTYAQFGDMLAYWDFYPTELPWGYTPAIGWGTVIESDVAGIDVGTHYSSWFPMATTVDILATPTSDGFRDDGPHRSPHAPTYRAFTDAQRDPTYTGEADEGRLSLLRGLYATGFLIDAFLDDPSRTCEQVVVLSASSKTAIGYAFCARARRNAAGSGPRVIGVTSDGNVEFTRSLGMYDDVVTYASLDAAGSGVAAVPTVVVDMAGAGAAVAALHASLGDHIVYSMIVGKSHHDAPPAMVTAGPQPEMFFAPGEVERRLNEWGPAIYRQRFADGMRDFVADSHCWLTLERVSGAEAVQAAWSRMLSGEVPPSVGLLVSFHD